MREFSRRACQKEEPLRKETLLAMIEPLRGTYEFFSSLPDSDWEIESFNPRKREVCCNITQKNQIKKVSVTLPPIV